MVVKNYTSQHHLVSILSVLQTPNHQSHVFGVGIVMGPDIASSILHKVWDITMTLPEQNKKGSLVIACQQGIWREHGKQIYNIVYPLFNPVHA